MSWDSFWSHDPAAMVSPGAAAALERWWRGFFSGRRWPAAPRLLEIASGATPAALHAEPSLSGDPARLYIAVDLSKDAAVAVARRAGPFRSAVADARSLPFRDASFTAVLSQFGVEYAGLRAVERAADLVAAEGSFAAILHLRGGAIASECERAAADLARFAAANVLAAARKALDASFSQSPSRRYADPALEKALGRALQSARTLIEPPQSNPRRLLARYLDDIESLSQRRFTFAPDEALGWLDRVGADLAGYRRRMSAMTEAAVGEPHMRALVKTLEAKGYAETRAEKLDLSGSSPAAWALVAVRR